MPPDPDLQQKISVSHEGMVISFIFVVSSILVISGTIFIYSSDVFGLDFEQSKHIYVVTLLGGAISLTKSYSNTRKKNAEKFARERLARIAERSNKADRSEQIAVLRDTIQIEAIGYSCFVNNFTFYLAFIALSGWILPKFDHLLPLSFTYLLSVSIPCMLPYKWSI